VDQGASSVINLQPQMFDRALGCEPQLPGFNGDRSLVRRRLAALREAG
jgi:hypothetical protein